MTGFTESAPSEALPGGAAAIEAEICRVLHDPAVSCWLHGALRTALDRNPLDAADDAERLRKLLERRLNSILPGLKWLLAKL